MWFIQYPHLTMDRGRIPFEFGGRFAVLHHAADEPNNQTNHNNGSYQS
jgi:hypothetical protein